MRARGREKMKSRKYVDVCWLWKYIAFALFISLIAMLKLEINVYAEDGEIVQWNGHRYQFCREGMDWHEAKEYCESRGGHLVTIIFIGYSS